MYLCTCMKNDFDHFLPGFLYVIVTVFCIFALPLKIWYNYNTLILFNEKK